MDDPNLNFFVRGATAMGHLIAGLFFLRFFWRIGDRLFLIFSIAFGLLGAIRIAMIFFEDPREHNYLYWIRFLAYLLIMAAIVDKNLPRPAGADDASAETLHERVAP
jgi:hypothetical protein